MMLKILKWIILVCIVGLIAAAGGINISLLLAKYSTEPILFLTGGAIVYVIIFITGTLIFTKNRGITMYTAGSLLMVMLTLSLLLPLSDEQNKPEAVEGQQFWRLSTGSKIAYVHLSGVKSLSLPPVVFLHGGPGISDMAGDSEYFGQLTSEGYEVYVYDEVGTGLSSRLQDPRGYTIQRDVDDLELIRQRIGTDKLILIDHSYGGEIAANYLASYGNHVEKAVFISPGAINPKDTSGGNLVGRLTLNEKWNLYRTLLHPRAMMSYILLQINPIAAQKFAGDDELDARFDLVYKYSQPAFHSRSKSLGHQLSGLGFYANQIPQSAAAKSKPDIRKDLTEKETPSLIIKASSRLRRSTLISLNRDLRFKVYKIMVYNQYIDNSLR